MERIPDICGDGFDPVEPERPELEGLGKCGQLCHDMASIRSVRRLIYVYDGRGGSTRPFQSLHSWYQTLRLPKRVGDCFSPLLVAAYLCTRLVDACKRARRVLLHLQSQLEIRVARNCLSRLGRGTLPFLRG